MNRSMLFSMNQTDETSTLGLMLLWMYIVGYPGLLDTLAIIHVSNLAVLRNYTDPGTAVELLASWTSSDHSQKDSGVLIGLS